MQLDDRWQYLVIYGLSTGSRCIMTKCYMGVTDPTLANELVGEIGLSPYGTFFAFKSMD